jgi:hypothetical protein
MKKISLGLIIITSVLIITPSSLALTPNPSTIKKEIRGNITENDRNKKEGLLNKVKDFMKKNLKFEARVRGKITLMGNSSFSLTGEDGAFGINITDKTKILRKFGGKSSLSEFSDGDEVIVFGRFIDDAKSIIEAKTVRNNSIQKRKGAFFGKVTAKNTDSFVMETLERGTLTIYFGSAKFVNRKEVSILYNDVKVGDRVRVKGIWDKTLSKITEVIQIKDFSLPVIVPKPTDSI